MNYSEWIFDILLLLEKKLNMKHPNGHDYRINNICPISLSATANRHLVCDDNILLLLSVSKQRKWSYQEKKEVNISFGLGATINTKFYVFLENL